MSKLSKQAEQINDLADIYEEEFGDNDYCFIVSPDGELKTIMLPDNVPFNTPEKVAKMLEIFGISDISNLTGTETIH